MQTPEPNEPEQTRQTPPKEPRKSVLAILPEVDLDAFPDLVFDRQGPNTTIIDRPMSLSLKQAYVMRHSLRVLLAGATQSLEACVNQHVADHLTGEVAEEVCAAAGRRGEQLAADVKEAQVQLGAIEGVYNGTLLWEFPELYETTGPLVFEGFKVGYNKPAARQFEVHVIGVGSGRDLAAQLRSALVRDNPHHRDREFPE